MEDLIRDRIISYLGMCDKLIPVSKYISTYYFKSSPGYKLVAEPDYIHIYKSLSDSTTIEILSIKYDDFSKDEVLDGIFTKEFLTTSEGIYFTNLRLMILANSESIDHILTLSGRVRQEIQIISGELFICFETVNKLGKGVSIITSSEYRYSNKNYTVDWRIVIEYDTKIPKVCEPNSPLLINNGQKLKKVYCLSRFFNHKVSMDGKCIVIDGETILLEGDDIISKLQTNSDRYEFSQISRNLLQRHLGLCV